MPVMEKIAVSRGRRCRPHLLRVVEKSQNTCSACLGGILLDCVSGNTCTEDISNHTFAIMTMSVLSFIVPLKLAQLVL